jgi:hypothetical protein
VAELAINHALLLFQFLDMIRSKNMTMALEYSQRPIALSAIAVLREFKTLYSSNQRKREDEETIYTNFECFVTMLEGITDNEN